MSNYLCTAYLIVTAKRSSGGITSLKFDHFSTDGRMAFKMY